MQKPPKITTIKNKSVPKSLGWAVCILYVFGAIFLDCYVLKLRNVSPIRIVWWSTIFLSLYQMGAIVDRKKETSRPIAKGRMIAIIPVFNEEDELVHWVIHSLLNQTRPPDEIHVVDDGSDTPIKPYNHPKVFWYRQQNQGKRKAQVSVIRRLNRSEVDFILTVDSDSVLSTNACELLMRAINKPQVHAVTGMTYTLNYRKNLLTRVLDLNMGISCILMQPSHNAVGALETTCGTLSIYRSRVLFDNVEDYLTSGTFGDDRRLNIYSLLAGDSIGVIDASTYTLAPETISGLGRQRLRWAKSPWIQLPFMLTNLRPHQLIFPMLSIMQWAIMLFIYIHIIVNIVTNGNINSMLYFFSACIYVRMLEAIVYLYIRPGMKLAEKVLTLIFITPLEVMLRFFVTFPIKTASLFMLKKSTWGTRKSVDSEKSGGMSKDAAKAFVTAANQPLEALHPYVVSEANTNKPKEKSRNSPPLHKERNHINKLRRSRLVTASRFLIIGSIASMLIWIHWGMGDAPSAEIVYNSGALPAGLNLSKENCSEGGDEMDPLIATHSANFIDLKSGELFAEVSIPKLSEDYLWSLFEGTDRESLAKGIGHYVGTAFPGEIGNFSIAANRNMKNSEAPFKHMELLSQGDSVFIRTKDIVYEYRITSSQYEVVSPSDTDEILPVPHEGEKEAEKALLTMTTCYPIYVSTHRMILHGELYAQYPSS